MPETIPHYNIGACVLFRADPAGPPVKFSVLSRAWNSVAREWEYEIKHQSSEFTYRTVGESHLSPCGTMVQ